MALSTISLVSQQMANTLAILINTIDTVEAIYVTGEDEGYSCRIITNHSTLAQREAIYEAQWQMVEQWGDTALPVEFLLIERDDRALSDLITMDKFEGYVNVVDTKDAR